MNQSVVDEPIEALFGDLSVDGFRKHHWRSRPLFVKGGARRFLDQTMTYEAFDGIVRGLREDAPDALREREGEVVFVEAMSRHAPDLAKACRRLSKDLGLRSGWFDAVRTFADSGIGCHYDHSDNFVLQQQGTKEWTIAPPDLISSRERACRMLNVGDFGAAEMAAGAAETYILEPGDLLYLPLFWIHSGVSKGESLSLSLVCPADPIQTVMLRAMRLVMTRHLLGHQPVPGLPTHLDAEEEAKWDKTMARSAALLLDRLKQEDLLQEIAEAMRQSLETEALEPKKAKE